MTPYDKSKIPLLRKPFTGIEKVRKNYSQSYQDMFVLTMLDGKEKGTYLEIGGFDPVFINNTYLLEKDFGWRGVSIDIEAPIADMFKAKRGPSNHFILSDALVVNYKKVFEEQGFPKQIDYLSIDIEPKTQTLECLKKLPLDTYRFSVITYETDFYDDSESRDIAERVRKESREILTSYGYELIVGNVANTSPKDVFEDWYVDPNIVDRKLIDMFKHSGDWNDSAEKFMQQPGSLIVATELYEGQGLGNQLWDYVVARIIADKRGASFSILGENTFKGADCMNLDFGKKLTGGISAEGGPYVILPHGIRNYYAEKKEVHATSGLDVTRTDKDLFDIPLPAKFDGNCQSATYLDGYREKIISWLTIKDEYKKYTTDDNTCVIHLRFGDFEGNKNVFLPATYYQNAMAEMKRVNPAMKFVCVTDQKEKAETMLPGVAVIGAAAGNETDSHKAAHHFGGPVGVDFSMLAQAKYLIIPNSSFSWWAAYINTRQEKVIAPKYWAAHNISDGYWSTADIITDGFTYLNRDGKLFSADECKIEKAAFENSHKDMFVEQPKPQKISFLKYLALSLTGQFQNKKRLIRKAWK